MFFFFFCSVVIIKFWVLFPKLHFLRGKYCHKWGLSGFHNGRIDPANFLPVRTASLTAAPTLARDTVIQPTRGSLLSPSRDSKCSACHRFPFRHLWCDLWFDGDEDDRQTPANPERDPPQSVLSNDQEAGNYIITRYIWRLVPQRDSACFFSCWQRGVVFFWY